MVEAYVKQHGRPSAFGTSSPRCAGFMVSTTFGGMSARISTALMRSDDARRNELR
jgi:hypothetical protein